MRTGVGLPWNGSADTTDQHAEQFGVNVIKVAMWWPFVDPAKVAVDSDDRPSLRSVRNGCIELMSR